MEDEMADEKVLEDGASTLWPPEMLKAAGATVRNGKLFVTRRLGKAGEESTEEEEVEVEPFVSPPAYVNVRYGVTLNMGEYESARIEVGLSLPCYAAEIDRTFDQVQSWVGERIEAERREVESEIQRRKKS